MARSGHLQQPADSLRNLMHLVCAKCGCQLTSECRLGDISEHNPLAQDRQTTVSAGVIVRLADLPPEERNYGLSFAAAAYAVNPADVLEPSLKPCGTDNGCCGSDGCDGPNRACRRCGTISGTEWSDCWTQAEFLFLPRAVEVVG